MSPPRIDIAALVSLSSSYGFSLSHDRARLAFYANPTGRFELYLMDLSTRTTRRITDGELPTTPRSRLIWLRDNRRLVYGKDAGGNEQTDLYSLDTTTRELRQLTHDPGCQDIALESHPDGLHLLMLSSRSGQLQLHTLNLETLQVTQRSSFNAPVTSAALAKDGSRLAFPANETPDPKNRDVYLMNWDGTGLQKIVSLEPGSQDIPVAWSEDGRRLALQSDAGGEWRSGTYDLESAELRWYSSGTPGMAEYPRAFSPDGRWLLCLRDFDAAYQPLLYDLQSGQTRKLLIPLGVASGGDWVSDTTLLCFSESPTSRTEVSLYDLETDSASVLRPADHGNIDADLFIEPEYRRYPSFDTQPVPAFVYTPRDAAPGERFPAIIDVHGGPTAHYPRSFNIRAQLLADRGYVVLLPNIRGSTGYGNAWRDANRHDWGGKDLQDVIEGAKYLQSRPDVIADRIAISGESFGGYMTYLASVKHPDLFRVAIPIIGITDLHQLHVDNSRLLPALAYYFRQMMGDPVENAALWRERSAISYAHQLQAKMLIIHGRNDPRCPLNQATAFIERLEAAGKQRGQDFALEIFDEGHGSADRKLAERNYRLMLDYLERHL